MKKQKKLTTEERAVQKILNKLISEETISHDFFIACVMAVKNDQCNLIEKRFLSFATTALDNHCKKLVEYAKSNYLDVPFKYKEYEKYAAEEFSKQFNALRRDESAEYYIGEAYKHIQLKIKQYETLLNDDKYPYEVTALLNQLYFDEINNAQDIQTTVFAIDAGANMYAIQ